MSTTPVDPELQKKQLEALIDATLPFAEQMLRKHGEFIPFGATMAPDGKETMTAGSVGEEHPKSRDIIEVLQQAYRRDGADGKILCCALAFDVRVRMPDTDATTDAVAIALDHRDGMSATVFYPYSIDDHQGVTIGESWASPGDASIFGVLNNG